MKNTILQVYEIVREESLPDIHSQGTILRHKKSGARVMLIANDDENKVFSIAFRTPPSDSTGVAHILEHSVLCGSRNFPLKDPFVELVKGSMNTFLNAMTYPDKTCYPVASCNDQDFQNLMHVYLDAVFYPNIYKREEIFRQEGHDLHLEDPEGPLTISGVVYNEMKGAFSSPDEVLERNIMNTLFPDTCYGLESGGDPEVIPELTYEQFLDFHRTYYHPSNSFIYLYGNMDMEEKLAFIDREYLSHFDSLDVDSKIPHQAPFTQVVEKEIPYPVAENESEEENTYLAWCMTTGGDGMDPVRSLAFEVLDYALLSVSGAPLEKALLDHQIGKDIYGSFEDGILQPYFTVIAKDARKDQKEEFCRIIREVLTDVADKGVDKKAVEAGINSLEFRYREADFASYPRGLIYGLDLMSDWIYSEEKPFAAVQKLEVFAALKEAVKDGYLEKLIRESLLSNTHGCILTLVPQKGFAVERDKQLADRLQAQLTEMTAEEKQRQIERTAALAAYQEAPEEPEALRCIPMLTRQDLGKKAQKLFNREYDLDGTLLLHHDVCTNGIAYLDLMFRTPDLTREEIHYMALLKGVLGSMDTENHTYGELANEINAGSGGILTGMEIFDDPASERGYQVMFSLRGKALYDGLGFLFRMFREIIERTDLSDNKRFHEIVARAVARGQESLMSAGHLTAVLRASSYGAEESLFQDEMAGIGFYRFIEELEKNFDERAEKTREGILHVMHRILRPENLIVSLTGEKEILEEVKELSLALRSGLYTEPVEQHASDLSVTVKNEGFKTPGQVQYVAQTGNFVRKGLTYTGALSILKVILGYDYLWTNVRVKGGAYGCMNGFKRDGQSFFVSYRDPHLKRTLDVFAGIPDYIRNFEADEREMTKYIIGAISAKDTPKTPSGLGSFSKTACFSRVTEEMLQKERDEILSATPEDIRALAPITEAILSDGHICVVGSETAVQNASDVLKEIGPLTTGGGYE